MVPEKKLILMVLLFLVTADILDSWSLTQIYNSETLESDHTSSEIWQQLPQWF